MSVLLVLGLVLLLALRPLHWLLLRHALPPRPSELPAGVDLITSSSTPTAVPSGTAHISILPQTPTGREHTLVLFVPGAGGQAAQFFANAPLFVPGGALHGAALGAFFSYPGHGLEADTYTHAALSPAALSARVRDVCEHALAQLPAQGRVVLVAHSYGCAVAPRVLVGMPELSGMVLLAPPLKRKRGALEGALLRAPAALLDVVRTLDRRCVDGNPGSAASVRRMLGVRAAAEFGGLQLWWNANTSSGAVTALARQADVPTAEQLGEVLRKWGKRVTLMFGERDRLTPASGGFLIAGAAGPECRFVLVEGDVGHQVMFEEAARVNMEIVRYVLEAGKGR